MRAVLPYPREIEAMFRDADDPDDPLAVLVQLAPMLA